jgi:ABC-type branched-subunit amino acid transport system ATPase component/ABC-type branched-subunit amino acid transport system permease subunit
MRAQKRFAIGVAVIAAILIASAVFPHEFPLGTVVYGILYGSLTGLLAIGLVVTYRVTRTINFAYGSMGGAAASVGVSLYLGHDLPWFLSIAIAVITGGLIGLAVGALLTWRFADAPRMVVTVATVGLAQLFGGLAVLIPGWLGGPDQLVGFKTDLTSATLSLKPVLFTGNDLLVLILVPATVALVSWLLLRTAAGSAVRAIADNQDRVRLLGVPARRLLLGTWVACGAVAGLTAVLQAPTQGVALNAAAGPALLLAPLSAAVIARMESLWIAFMASIFLGVLQAVVGLNAQKQSIQTPVLLAVVIAALLLQPRQSGRADNDESSWSAAGSSHPIPDALKRLPEVRALRVLLPIVVIVAAASLPLFVRPDQLNQATSAIVFGLAAISLVVLTGWGGTVSLGQVALVGVGAVTAGNLMMRWNLDLFQSLLAAGVAGGVMAVVLGAPALRVKGQYLAVTTLTFAVAAEHFFFNPTNFADQLPDTVTRPVLWKRFPLSDETNLYFVALGILVLVIALTGTARRARPGRAIVSTRDNARAAEAAAIPSTRTKMLSFVIAGVIAGVAGGLNVVNFGGVIFGSFPTADSLLVFSTAVIGGLTSIGGVLAGVVLVQWLGVAFPTYQILLTGIGVVLILAVFPAGIAGLGTRARDAALTRLARVRGLNTSVWSSGNEDSDVELAAAVSIVDGVENVVLGVHGVEASYGSLQVLFGVDLVVGRGEIVALLGTNGAGKSSVLRCVAGLLKTGKGDITIDGRSAKGVATEVLAQRGIAMVPGGRGTFPSLTVAENLDVARWLIRRDPDAVRAVRERVLDLFPALEDRWEIRAGELSGGEQQMLSIAMALFSRPHILCIDELSLGLSPVMVEKLIEAVKAINAEGVTVVLVEQSINTACLVADRAIFLEKGRVRFTGPTEDLRNRPDLLRAVFLPDPEELAATESARESHGDSADRVVLSCTGVTKHFGGITAVDGVSLEVRQGEILGLIGHNGAGKTTLFDLLSGFLPLDAGEIVLDGLDLTAYPAHVRALAGLGRSFQEARLFPGLTVRETVMVAMERHLASRDPIAAAMGIPASTDSEAVALEEVERILTLVGLHDYRDKLTGALSTGTRRVVELACVLAQRPSVLLLDEPSGGVAAAESEALIGLLRKVASDTGCSIVIIEHDMGIMTSLCDRLIGLESGRVITEGTCVEVLTHPQVVASYLGTSESEHAPIAHHEPTALLSIGAEGEAS